MLRCTIHSAVKEQSKKVAYSKKRREKKRRRERKKKKEREKRIAFKNFNKFKMFYLLIYLHINTKQYKCNLHMVHFE